MPSQGFKESSDPDTVHIQVSVECPNCKLIGSCSFDNQKTHINGNFLAKTIQCTFCKYYPFIEHHPRMNTPK